MIGRWLVRLYPADWRARYGDEFLDLLESRPLNLRSAIDVVFGAMDAHLDSQFGPYPKRRLPMSARLLGLAAVGSGLILTLGILFESPGGLPFRLMMFYPLALAGMIGVHRLQAATAPILAWVGLAPAVIFAGLSAVGILAGAVGLPLALNGQAGFVLGAGFWISTMFFGIATAVIGVAPRLGAAAMAVGAPLALVGMSPFNPGVLATLVAQTGVIVFGFGLMWLGLTLILGREGASPLPG